MTNTHQNLPLFELIEGFVVELRSAGLPVSLVENIDAIEAVKEIPLDDRDAFKYALAATLVKNQSHWKTFETLFEVYFSIRGAEYLLDPDADNPFGDLDLDMECRIDLVDFVRNCLRDIDAIDDQNDLGASRLDASHTRQLVGGNTDGILYIADAVFGEIFCLSQS